MGGRLELIVLIKSWVEDEISGLVAAAYREATSLFERPVAQATVDVDTPNASIKSAMSESDNWGLSVKNRRTSSDEKVAIA